MPELANQEPWELIAKVTLVVIGFYACERIIYLLLRRHIIKKAAKENSPIRILTDVIMDALSPPMRVVLFGAIIFSIEHIFRFSLSTKIHLKSINDTCITILVFWALYRMCVPLSHIMDGWGMDTLGKRFTDELRKFLVSIMRASLLVMAAIALLDVWHVNVGPLLAGLGLLGVAISFAAQETIKHFFGGITLIMDRPFQEGDWIQCDTVEGLVERVGLRSTRVRQLDDMLAVIPNADLANARILNKSAIQNWRLNTTIWVSYNTPNDTLMRIEKAIQDYLTNHPRVDMSVRPAFSLVNLANFGGSAYEILCDVYTRETDWKSFTKLRAEFLFAFSKIVTDLGATMPYSSQSIYIEKVPASLENLLKAS
ncbi:MAG: hypothetical protein C0514_02730 [Candidatus Puniceispirillum sp.]|nr:hypothetical protein [Candidatus Puniceispirillum sp.]